MRIPINQQIEHFKLIMSEDANDLAILATLQFCEMYLPEIKQFISDKGKAQRIGTDQDQSDKISKATTHCCVMLNDKQFQSFLYKYADKNLDNQAIQSLTLDTDQDYHPAILRKVLKIKSRSEISKDKQAFTRWRKLFDTFTATQQYEGSVR